MVFILPLNKGVSVLIAESAMKNFADIMHPTQSKKTKSTEEKNPFPKNVRHKNNEIPINRQKYIEAMQFF